MEPILHRSLRKVKASTVQREPRHIINEWNHRNLRMDETEEIRYQLLLYIRPPEALKLLPLQRLQKRKQVPSTSQSSFPGLQQPLNQNPLKNFRDLNWLTCDTPRETHSGQCFEKMQKDKKKLRKVVLKKIMVMWANITKSKCAQIFIKTFPFLLPNYTFTTLNILTGQGPML